MRILHLSWSVFALAALGSTACGSDGTTSGGEPCFTPDTLVRTPEGERPIGELVPGDEVYSYCHESNQPVVRKVEVVHRNLSRTRCRVKTSGGVFRGITPAHPIFDQEQGDYVALRDLKPDARLLTFDGASASVEELSIEEASEPRFEVVNLTVEGPEHNYFADGLLVHNKQCDQCICGDGLTETGNDEQCDDGNTESGDGCSATCQLEGQGGAGGTGGGGNGGSGGNPAGLAVCLQACNSPADCDMGAGPAFDADNYSCDTGTCIYLGCNDDTECAPLNQVCRQTNSALLGEGQFCVPPCAAPADCDLGIGPAFDADNYECVNGGCSFTGCNDDTECASLMGANYVCREVVPGLNACQVSCQSAADCDIGGGAAFDADNYSCPQDHCVYTGCNDNTECASLPGNQVCVEP